MKVVILFALLTGQIEERIISGTGLVFESGLLPERYLTCENKEYENRALSLLDSLIADDKSLRPFDSILISKGFKLYPDTLEIVSRYYFSGIPCLYFYFLNTGSIDYGWDFRMNFKYLYYNYCNSSIYYLGSGLESFGKVFQPLIADARDSTSFTKLVMLYLNTITFSGIYYELRSFDDLLVRYADTLLHAGQELDCDRNIVNQIFENRPERYVHDTQEMRIFTWSLSTGAIDYWHFQIEEDALVLRYSKTITRGVGPYQRWRD
jgi:hypothetical protein